MRTFVVGIFVLGAATAALAQDGAVPAPEAAAGTEAGETSATTEPVEVRLGAPPSHMNVRDRWENALDVKLTDLYDRTASNVTSPTIMLNAEWNYKFVTDTFLGAVIGGLPQPIKRTTEDEVKISYSTYYLGARLAQGIFDIRPFRLVLGVNAARGFLYTRVQTVEGDSKAEVLKYNLVEPGMFFTFWIYQGVEFGIAGSYRMVSVLDEKEHEDVVTNDDLTSLAYGLTFRTQRF